MKLTAGILLFLGFLSSEVLAQLPGKTETSFLYRQEWTGMFTLQTQGWGFGVRYGKQKTAEVKHLWNFDIATAKHAKQKRVVNAITDDAKPYFFGKINSFAMFRPQYGRKKILYQKKRESGVEIGYAWTLGPTIGFLKPIYLEICKSSGGNSCIPTTERYDPETHSTFDIFGRAPRTAGLAELKIKPGLGAKLSMFFDWSSDEERIKALEIGTTFDVFSSEIPVMTGIDNNSFWYQSFYISFVFGKKLF